MAPGDSAAGGTALIASKEVQFVWQEISKLIPRETKHPDTELRRQSLIGVSIPAPSTGDGQSSVTIPTDDSAEVVGTIPEPQQGTDFTDFESHEISVYELQWKEVQDDVQARVLALASKCISKPDKAGIEPVFPFTPIVLSNLANSNDFKFRGNLPQDKWNQLLEKFNDEMYKEDKARTFLVIALVLLTMDLHTICLRLSRDMKNLGLWVCHIQNLRAEEAKETEDRNAGDGEAAQDSLIEEIEQRDRIIAEKDRQIRDLLEENRVLSKKILDAASAPNPRTPVGQVRFAVPGMSPASGRLRSPFTGRVASASDAGLSSSGRRSAKIDGPPTWDGDATTSKISFEGWYRALENKLLVNKDHFDDEEAMKSYVENRLTGDALDSLLPFLADDHPDKITTLEELLQWLQHEYVDQTAKQKARKDYEKLQMKPSDTLQGFKNDFVRLAGRAKKAKADWKEDFNDKLTVQLRDQMTIAFVNPDVDFNNFVSLAMQHDIQNKQNYERRQAAKSTGTMTGGSSSRTRIRQGGARPAGGSSSTPSQSPAARPDKLLAPAGPEEMKQLIKEGKCFLCRKQGHMTGSCPDKNLYRPQRPRLTEDRIQEIVDKYYPPKDAPDAADDTSDVGSDGDSDPKN